MKTIIGISGFNFTFIALGILFLSIGLYGTVPLKFDKIFWIQNGTMTVFLAVCLYFFIQRFRAGAGVTWGIACVDFGGRFVPIMTLLCFVMGMGKVLTQIYSAEIAATLINYPNASPLGGALSVPTPTTLVGVIIGNWHIKSLIPNFLFVLNAGSLMSLPLFVLRTAGFPNLEICKKMYLFGVFMSLICFPLRVPITWLVNKVYLWF